MKPALDIRPCETHPTTNIDFIVMCGIGQEAIVECEDRTRFAPLFECLDDYVSEDNPVDGVNQDGR